MIRKILVILILACSYNCSGQAGYIGQINEISVDAFSAIYTQKFEFTYKISPLQNYSFYFNYGFCNASHDLPTTEYPGLHVIDINSNNYSSNTTELTPNEIKSAKVSANVTTFGLGILYNSSSNNMQMPIGYYSGIGVHFMSGTNTDEYQLNNPLPSGFTNTVPYHLKETSIRMIFGKNTALGSNITLDLALSAGYSWGHLTLNETTTQGILESYPFSQFPTSAPVFWSRNFTPEYDYATANLYPTSYNYRGLFLMPNVRLGFMF